MKLVAQALCTSELLHLDHGVVLMSSWREGRGLLMGASTAIWWNPQMFDFQTFFRSIYNFLDKILHRNPVGSQPCAPLHIFELPKHLCVIMIVNNGDPII